MARRPGVWNNKDKTRDRPEASRKTKLRLSNRLSKYRDEISIDGLSGIDRLGRWPEEGKSANWRRRRRKNFFNANENIRWIIFTKPINILPSAIKILFDVEFDSLEYYILSSSLWKLEEYRKFLYFLKFRYRSHLKLFQGLRGTVLERSKTIGSQIPTRRKKYFETCSWPFVLVARYFIIF